jgi:hypothetical protein
VLHKDASSWIVGKPEVIQVERLVTISRQVFTAIGSNLRATKGFPEAISCRSSRLVSLLEIQNHVNDGFLTD